MKYTFFDYLKSSNGILNSKIPSWVQAVITFVLFTRFGILIGLIVTIIATILEYLWIKKLRRQGYTAGTFKNSPWSAVIFISLLIAAFIVGLAYQSNLHQ